MPIKLNVSTHYAKVEPEFVDLMKEIWKKQWSKLNDDIKVQRPSYREMRAKGNAPMMSRLKLLCTNKEALDKEITRLRGLPYDRFYVREYKGKKWFVGLTQPIVMNDDFRIYQAPRYLVYVPLDVTDRGVDSHFHFVPEGYEMITARHPHHNIGGLYSDQSHQPPNPQDPLDYVPSTCWGSFGTIAGSCIRSGDIADLYRNLGIYLTRINQNSLLTRPFGACHFLVDIGPAPEKKPATITKKTKFYDR